ncbi:unnamed protein product [Acanthoscelides obtectus]|uniref:Uncharacterized protein n=1 Tax=Acanthoscelides obtectus TaxID=200917 RepID=A0A9P0PX93_ACAOB|nr:unnamed protein product [Acanthoscelides obtectus]CAK1674687.1 hypothetical protein AOBTE_LOCUS29705 [Acanthoscelides obtectus]
MVWGGSVNPASPICKITSRHCVALLLEDHSGEALKDDQNWKSSIVVFA